jgi:hypothetical protein
MVINIFALDSSNKEDPEYSLVGHTDNVCVIHVGPAGVIISGSWDKYVNVFFYGQSTMRAETQDRQSLERLQASV